TYYADKDGDGFGSTAAGGELGQGCAPAPSGQVTVGGDCNDDDPKVHPGQAEVCNGVDDDCNGKVDDGLTFTDYYPDKDGDGYGSSAAAAQSSCKPVAGKVTSNSDCNDANAGIHPGATEVCNGVDDNCNGQVDDGLVFSNY